MKLSTLPRQQFKKLMHTYTLSPQQVQEWIADTGCLIIGVGMLKGGTGKTTTSIFMALYLSVVLDLKVCVVDTDAHSQSVDEWHSVRERRDEKVPFDLHVYDPQDEKSPELDDVLAALSEKYQVVIVDIGGAGKDVYFELCLMAHLLVVPLAPSGIESSRLLPTVRTANRGAKAKGGGQLPVFVLFVKCNNNTTLSEEERAAVEAQLPQLNAPECDVHLVPPDFQISSDPAYVRAWREKVKRAHLEEIGWLLRYVARQVADRQKEGVTV